MDKDARLEKLKKVIAQTTALPGLGEAIAQKGHNGYLCIWCGATQKQSGAMVVGFTGGVATVLCDICIVQAYNELPPKMRPHPTF